MTQSADRLGWYHIAVNGFRGHTLLTLERAAELNGRFSVVPIDPPDLTARVVPLLMTLAKHANGSTRKAGSDLAVAVYISEREG